LRVLVVQCVNCQEVGFATDHSNPDAALECGCCPGGEGHPVLPDGRPDHAANALACPGDHAEPHGVDVHGCTVCRPVKVILPPGQVVMQHAAGQGA
jgi:hypothetical protein